MQKEILKEKIKENYGKIALNGNLYSYCGPQESRDTNNFSKKQMSSIIGYKDIELKSIPEESILGLGCGAPLKFANLKGDETVVDMGSGAGIDAFLASKLLGKEDKVIGIDMTDEMLEKARKTSIANNYKNIEFRNGDIEEKIPIEDNSVGVVISNYVINLTSNKTNTFKEIYHILKKNGNPRMIISDLITTKEINNNNVNMDNGCSCIDGALTKENYLQSIKDAGQLTDLSPTN